MNGWIRLHRKIRSHWIYENPDYLRAWIALLIEVNHTPDKVLIKSKLLNVARGQSVKSLDTWASIFGHGWTKQKVRTFFRLLENDRMINTQNEHVTTRLTVCNYDTYQDVQHASNTQYNTDVTRVQHASNTRLTPNKNDKKVKNEKEERDSSAIQELVDWSESLGAPLEVQQITKWRAEIGRVAAETDFTIEKQAIAFRWARSKNMAFPKARFWRQDILDWASKRTKEIEQPGQWAAH
jgi:hypothetical protein